VKISFLCSDGEHPVNEYLQEWINRHKNEHCLELVRTKENLSGGDILFLVSCYEIITEKDRSAYATSLVIHASDLPKGRGWSPHIWQIIEGGCEITLSLLDVEDKLDSGKVWKKLKFKVPKHALFDEINKQMFDAEIELIDYAIRWSGCVEPKPQLQDIAPTYYPRRRPADSKIDPSKSIESQFNHIRVCDPVRFPAFFWLNGNKYKIKLEKFNE
jgi:methionyl-tRNA formyltransferase